LALLGSGDLDGGIRELTRARETAGVLDHPALIMVEPLLGLLAEDDERVRAHLERNLDHADPWSRAMTRLLRGHVRGNEGDRDGAEADLAWALAEFRALGDRFGRSITTSALGWARAVRGDNAGAATVLEEALGLLAELGCTDELAELHTRLALIRARAGDLAGARTDLTAAEAIADRYGGFESTMTVELTRAELARVGGDLAGSRRHYESALARMTQSRATIGQLRAMILVGLGYVAVAAGELDVAGQRLADAVEAAIGSRDMPVVAETAQAAADLALAQGDAGRAALLLGVAVAVRGGADEGSPDVARIGAGAAAALGAPAYAAAYQRGAAMSRDAALATLRPTP
jgi:hypothetical protein